MDTIRTALDKVGDMFTTEKFRRMKGVCGADFRRDNYGNFTDTIRLPFRYTDFPSHLDIDSEVDPNILKTYQGSLQFRNVKWCSPYWDAIKNITLGQVISSGSMNDVYTVNEDPNLVVRLLKPKYESKPLTVANELHGYGIQKYFSSGLFGDPDHGCNKIGKIYQYGQIKDSNRLYSIMDRIHGDELQTVLESILNGSRPLLADSDIKQLFLTICRSIYCLHIENTGHFDIKPENIMVEEGNNIKLIDFGLATDQFDKLVHARVGTPRYMAPETKISGLVDIKADIWSLGMLLWIIVTVNRKSDSWNKLYKVNVMEEMYANLKRMHRGLYNTEAIWKQKQEEYVMYHSRFIFADVQKNIKKYLCDKTRSCVGQVPVEKWVIDLLTRVFVPAQDRIGIVAILEMITGSSISADEIERNRKEIQIARAAMSAMR